MSAAVNAAVDGLTIGMVYVLLAAGLSVIFGVMDVINFAHGELFALGAYFAVAVVGGGGSFWLALLAAPLGVAFLAALVERTAIRPLYDRNPLYHVLVTFGLVLVFKDLIEAVWGTQPYPFGQPSALSESVTVAGYTGSAYGFFVIGIGAVVAVGGWLVLTRTRYGLIVRAGSMDREMVRHLGIDVDRFYTLVFAFGAALAALGGVVLGARGTVGPGIGDAVVITAFVVVVLGGLGSFAGAVVGGIGVGLVQSFTRTFLPTLEGLVVFGVMILVLLVRPQGVFGDPEWDTPTAGGLRTAGGRLDDRVRSRLGVAVLVVLSLAPLGIGVVYSPFLVNSLLVTVMVWALFALSLDLVMGYAGLVSLGHVLFYGIGGYATVLMVVHVVPSIFVGLAVGVVVAAALAWVVGGLSIRVSGVYFAMVTLAFAELFATLAFRLNGLTGGENGIYQPFDPVYGLTGGPAVGDVALLPGGEVFLFYYLVLAAVVGAYLVVRRVVRAPFGRTLTSIREAERRTRFLGYDVTAHKRRAFVLSGGLAGLAGGLATVELGGVSPAALAWIKSGELIVMTLLGGLGTLYGPMLGAGLFFGIREALVIAGIDHWQGVLGAVFVAFVVYVPEGLVSVPAVIADRVETGRLMSRTADGDVEE